MIYIIVALAFIISGGFVALLTGSARIGGLISTICTAIGAILSFIPVVTVLLTGIGQQYEGAWNFPYGHFALNLDPLSAFFMVPLLILAVATSLFGTGYLSNGKKRNGYTWFSFNILIASMILILLANNGLLFLLAWEIMSISSLILVLYDHEDTTSQRAAWIYFTASHAGVAFLLVLFFNLSQIGGSFDFSNIHQHSITGPLSTLLFFIAVVGFGCKAGFMPLHVWLPDAHPAAPSHVSALMSAIMIKMGIYGIFRTLTFLGTPHLSWGIALLVVGVLSGCMGILLASGQRDIKRLLAYSSVENMGIITISIGIGLIGLSLRNSAISVLGFTGALLHVMNHAFFKGLLFLSAGVIVHSTGTRDMEKLGGLIKKLPATGIFFIIGAFAICGLPPLNGFISEYLIYMAGLTSVSSSSPFLGVCGLIIIIALALIGGMALMTFTKAIGVIFLGEPRSTLNDFHNHVPLSMKSALSILTVACVVMSFGFFFMNQIFVNLICFITQYTNDITVVHFLTIKQGFSGILAVSVVLVVLVSILIIIRKKIVGSKSVSIAVTWDCGYAKPDPRMQYTGSSFVQSLTSFLSILTQQKIKLNGSFGNFPSAGTFRSDFSDLFMRNLFIPVFNGVYNGFSKLKWLQGGKVHIYVLYIALALISALIITFVK
jgi:formate hydrogenlyase subunit 3/multisubunit Na+/H+ antiporter MnhD subunit